MKRPFQFKLRWDGADLVLVPSDKRVMDECDKEFADGEIITFERNEERSDLNHNHFFAWLHEAFLQLPESLQSEYPTEDSLRAKALIKCGYSTEKDVVCESEQMALSVAAVCSLMSAYTIVEVRGNVVKIHTAKSQSRQAMNKKEFQESKDKVIDFVSALVGISPEELRRNAGKAA